MAPHASAHYSVLRTGHILCNKTAHEWQAFVEWVQSAAAARRLERLMNAYMACCVALRDCDLTAQAAKIAVPTLCIVGELDGSTPPAIVGATSKLIPNAQFEVMQGVAHLPCIENPRAYAELIANFISGSK